MDNEKAILDLYTRIERIKSVVNEIASRVQTLEREVFPEIDALENALDDLRQSLSQEWWKPSGV